MSHDARVTLTIPTTPKLSDVWSEGQVRSTVGNSADMMIFSPSGCGVEVASSYKGSDWSPLYQDGVVVAVLANKVFSIPVAAFGDLRVTGADQAVQVVFQVAMV